MPPQGCPWILGFPDQDTRIPIPHMRGPAFHKTTILVIIHDLGILTIGLDIFHLPISLQMIAIAQILMIAPRIITSKTFPWETGQILFRHHLPHTLDLRGTNRSGFRIKRMRTEAKEPFRLLYTVRTIPIIPQIIPGKQRICRETHEKTFRI